MLVSIVKQIRGVGDCLPAGKRGGFRQLRIAGPSITGCLGVQFGTVPALRVVSPTRTASLPHPG
jgi:hypothetical protein